MSVSDGVGADWSVGEWVGYAVNAVSDESHMTAISDHKISVWFVDSVWTLVISERPEGIAQGVEVVMGRGLRWPQSWRPVKTSPPGFRCLWLS